jgi:hypothetical protein
MQVFRKKMSANALKDLDISQSAELEKGRDSSVKSCPDRPVANGHKCGNKEECAPPACLDAVTNGNGAATIDVEYIDSEGLVDLLDVDVTLSVCCYFLFMVFYCTVDFSFRFYSLCVTFDCNGQT